ncbi:hypothetical protein VTH06DRAFT_705 [Thermothelomyces fergusii]
MSPLEHTRIDAPVTYDKPCDESYRTVPDDFAPTGFAAHSRDAAASLAEGDALEDTMDTDGHYFQDVFNLFQQTQTLSHYLAPLLVQSNKDNQEKPHGISRESVLIEKPSDETLCTPPCPDVVSTDDDRTSLDSPDESPCVSEATSSNPDPSHLTTGPRPVFRPAGLRKQEAPETPHSDVARCIEGRDVEDYFEVAPSNDRTEVTLPNISREQQVSWAPGHSNTFPPPSGGVVRAGGSKAGFEEFFTIRPSKLGGLGAFATRELRRGETILTERPLLRTTHFRLMLDYHNLSDAAKKTYLSLHGGEDGDRFGRVERVKVLNSFQVPGGVAIFETASRFNHACPPARNVRYEFDDARGLLSLTVCHDAVPAGAELLISYGGSPAELYSTYGFRCACGGCAPLTDDDIRTLMRRRFGAEDCGDECYDASEW